MRDSYGRIINYMRISVTERCNLHCLYCRPETETDASPEDFLSAEEIVRIASCAAKLGIRHLRLTGGEPLLRADCCRLAAALKKIPGIRTVTLTTNGLLLGRYLEELLAAGIDGVNVSLDTLRRERYAALTGRDALEEVTASIRRAVGAHLPLKINAVLPAAEEEDVWELISFAKESPVDVRFIELMPIGAGKGLPGGDCGAVVRQLRERFPGLRPEAAAHGFGPAVYYRIPGYAGSIGFIGAMHQKFCGHCNRVRLTARGYFKTCLCYEDGINLRPLLEDRGPSAELSLCRAMEEAVANKPGEHCFETQEGVTERHGMAAIGG